MQFDAKSERANSAGCGLKSFAILDDRDGVELFARSRRYVIARLVGAEDVRKPMVDEAQSVEVARRGAVPIKVGGPLQQLPDASVWLVFCEEIDRLLDVDAVIDQ